MNFQVLILGANSALPGPKRFPSAQVLCVQDHLYLIDCGEGCQIKMIEFGVKRSRINQIFVSHLHGDHVFGLPGLLSTYTLLDRTDPLDIFGPPGIEKLISAVLENAGIALSYKINFHLIDTLHFQPIFEDDVVRVFSIPLKHLVPTCGFLFIEKPKPRNIKTDVIEKYKMSYDQIRAVKDGKDLELGSGELISNDALTLIPPSPRKYAYCSDTSYDVSLAKRISGVDLLYHEATYMHELVRKAKDRGHSTAKEAAMVAKAAKAKKLIIGHYSNRYRELDPLLQEARSVFENTALAEEGCRFDV